MFRIIIKLFLDGLILIFGDLIYLLLAKGLYFETSILSSMNESILQTQSFPRDFCMFDIIVAYIDSNSSSVSLSLTVVSAFQFK